MRLLVFLTFFLLMLNFVVAQEEEAPAEEGAEGAEEGGEEAAEDAEWSAQKPIDAGDLENTSKLMALLQNGDETVMNIVYVVGIKDSSITTLPQAEWQTDMEMAVNTLTLADVSPSGDEGGEEAPAEGEEAPAEEAPAEEAPAEEAPAEGEEAAAEEGGEEADSDTITADDCKEIWKDTKTWPAESIQFGIIDLNGDEHKNTKASLIDPYYTGPDDRAVPAIFILMGNSAYLVTGPNAIDALQKTVVKLGKEMKK